VLFNAGGPLVVAALFTLLAGLLACLEVALSRVSRVRVEELVREERPGALRLQQVMADPPRALNLLLLLRMICELSAVGIVVAYCLDRIDGSLAVVTGVAVMTVVTFVFVGVAPRTIGRQHADRVALRGAGVAAALTRLFGPLPTLLILIGNAVTPGKGFQQGPFASEAELRDLVEMAQERGVVERAERDMINSVFELGDTIASLIARNRDIHDVDLRVRQGLLAVGTEERVVMRCRIGHRGASFALVAERVDRARTASNRKW